MIYHSSAKHGRDFNNFKCKVQRYSEFEHVLLPSRYVSLQRQQWYVEDPALLRQVVARRGRQWLSTDPLSDLYPLFSPFAYAVDNPVTFNDPDGDSVTTNWQYGLDDTINFFVTTPVNGTRSDRQGGSWDLLPSEYTGTKTFEWTELISRVEQDLPALSLMDNQRADGSSWTTLQHQAALEAKAETNALIKSFADASDRISEYANIAALGEAG